MAAVTLGSVSPAYAQRGVGVRAGVSINPEQFYIGGHVMTGPIVDRLWFRPNVEVGFSDNTTSVDLNGEFAYWARVPRRDANVYFGAGPAINIFSHGEFRSRQTSVGPGFNFLLGLASPKGWFAEIKVGALDSPTFKLGIGYTFR
jgi:hypothetical protein